MSTLFASGLETGSLDEFPSHSYDWVSVSDEQARTGNYSLKMVPTTDSNLEPYAAIPLPVRDSLYEAYIRVCLYQEVTGAYWAADRRFLVIEDWIGAGQLLAYITGTQLIIVNNNTVHCGGFIPLNDWTCIELHVLFNNTTGIIQAKVEGELVINFTGDTWPISAGGAIHGIFLSGDRIADDTIKYFDDIVVTTDRWPGRGGIEGLVPTGAGATTGLTPSTGSDNYALVDSLDDTSYVYTASSAYDTYTMSNPTLTGNVHSVHWSTRAQIAQPGESLFRRVFRIGGTDYRGSERGVDVDFDTVFEVVEENPDTSTDWTTTDLTNMEVGVEIV